MLAPQPPSSKNTSRREITASTSLRPSTASSLASSRQKQKDYSLSQQQKTHHPIPCTAIKNNKEGANMSSKIDKGGPDSVRPNLARIAEHKEQLKYQLKGEELKRVAEVWEQYVAGGNNNGTMKSPNRDAGSSSDVVTQFDQLISLFHVMHVQLHDALIDFLEKRFYTALHGVVGLNDFIVLLQDGSRFHDQFLAAHPYQKDDLLDAFITVGGNPDCGGYMSVPQMQELIDKFHLQVDIQRIVEELDSDGNALIDFWEFAELLRGKDALVAPSDIGPRNASVSLYYDQEDADDEEEPFSVEERKGHYPPLLWKQGEGSEIKYDPQFMQYEYNPTDDLGFRPAPPQPVQAPSLPRRASSFIARLQSWKKGGGSEGSFSYKKGPASPTRTTTTRKDQISEQSVIPQDPLSLEEGLAQDNSASYAFSTSVISPFGSLHAPPRREHTSLPRHPLAQQDGSPVRPTSPLSSSEQLLQKIYHLSRTSHLARAWRNNASLASAGSPLLASSSSQQPELVPQTTDQPPVVLTEKNLKESQRLLAQQNKQLKNIMDPSKRFVPQTEFYRKLGFFAFRQNDMESFRYRAIPWLSKVDRSGQAQKAHRAYLYQLHQRNQEIKRASERLHTANQQRWSAPSQSQLKRLALLASKKQARMEALSSGEEGVLLLNNVKRAPQQSATERAASKKKSAPLHRQSVTKKGGDTSGGMFELGAEFTMAESPEVSQEGSDSDECFRAALANVSTPPPSNNVHPPQNVALKHIDDDNDDFQGPQENFTTSSSSSEENLTPIDEEDGAPKQRHRTQQSIAPQFFVPSFTAEEEKKKGPLKRINATRFGGPSNSNEADQKDGKNRNAERQGESLLTIPFLRLENSTAAEQQRISASGNLRSQKNFSRPARHPATSCLDRNNQLHAPVIDEQEAEDAYRRAKVMLAAQEEEIQMSTKSTKQQQKYKYEHFLEGKKKEEEEGGNANKSSKKAPSHQKHRNYAATKAGRAKNIRMSLEDDYGLSRAACDARLYQCYFGLHEEGEEEEEDQLLLENNPPDDHHDIHGYKNQKESPKKNQKKKKNQKDGIASSFSSFSRRRSSTNFSTSIDQRNSSHHDGGGIEVGDHRYKKTAPIMDKTETILTPEDEAKLLMQLNNVSRVEIKNLQKMYDLQQEVIAAQNRDVKASRKENLNKKYLAFTNRQDKSEREEEE